MLLVITVALFEARVGKIDQRGVGGLNTASSNLNFTYLYESGTSVGRRSNLQLVDCKKRKSFQGIKNVE